MYDIKDSDVEQVAKRILKHLLENSYFENIDGLENINSLKGIETNIWWAGVIWRKRVLLENINSLKGIETPSSPE